MGANKFIPARKGMTREGKGQLNVFLGVVP